VRRLAVLEKLVRVGSAQNETAAGRYPFAYFRARFLGVGKFTIGEPIFSESRRHNQLGLCFWSRFAVTFDFPGQKILLRGGAGFVRPDRRYLPGPVLVRDGESVVIESDDPVAGIRTGDVLVKLGDLQAAKASLFELRSTFCSPGRVECIVRRGSTEHRLTLNIAP
jgi:hypothetical protein